MSRRPAQQFVGFCVVGTGGFLIDAGSLYLLLVSGALGPYVGRVVSYIIAATATWWLNRRYTFPSDIPAQPAVQWGRYVVWNVAGALVNYLAYVLALRVLGLTDGTAVIGVAIGSVAGLALNFATSRFIVFRKSAA